MKLAFVIPWFGDLSGGAESVCLDTARRMHERGVPVEILTTCIKQLQSDWMHNYHAPGIDTVGGLPVRRFPVGPRDTAEFLRINDRLIRRLSVTPKEQATFVREMIRCDELTSFVERNADDYVYLFLPYMFSTTYWGTLARPDRSVVIPCLHDEGYAFLDLFKPVFEQARGLLFHSRAEMNLANRLYGLRPGSQALVGGGVDTNVRGDAERFREKYNLDQFLLYVGRQDAGKNAPLLVNYFCRYKERCPCELKLVLIGDGSVPVPENHESQVINLGRLTAVDKRNACAAAIALCQPSTNESFSLVLMEAWTNETPVLVHADCAATREHCLASNGGLYFSSFDDFAGCVDHLTSSARSAQAMGRAGKRYVMANYTWDHVLDRYSLALRQWGFAF